MKRTPTKGLSGHQSARPGTEIWLTPPEIIEALGGWQSFSLDPCSLLPRPWPTAQAHYYSPINGLAAPWAGRVWLNPPYTQPGIMAWLARMAAHAQGTALLPARTETKAFAAHVWGAATALLFMEGRPHFHHACGARARGNSGAPIVLCAYGQDDADILADIDIKGAFVPLRIPRIFAAALFNQTWGQLVESWMRDHPGPVSIANLYRHFRDHAKAQGNRHVRAKLRQTLQRGHYRPVKGQRGVWELA